MAVDTGHGAALTFSSNTGYNAFLATSIQIGSISINDIETSNLDTTGFRSYISGDLKDTPEVTINYRFDPEDADHNPTLGAVETLDITFPISDTNNTQAAVFDGSGYVKDVSGPTLETDTVMDGTLVFKFDGVSAAPTFTAET